MSYQRMLDGDVRPTEDEIENTIGENSFLWSEMRKHLEENYPGSTCWLIGIPDLGKGAVIMTNGAKGNQLAMEVLIALAIKNGWPNVDE